MDASEPLSTPAHSRTVAVGILSLAVLVASAAAVSSAPIRSATVTGPAAAQQGGGQKRFCVALDIGHLPNAPGAVAADGKSEYEFNMRVVEKIVAELRQDDELKVVVVNAGGKRISLTARASAAKIAGADLFLAIHHDSVNDRYLEPYQQLNGRVLYKCDRFRGYSVFYSQKNIEHARSLQFALALGAAMRRQGLVATMHHAEKIRGENRELVNAECGVYRFDDLVVLKSALMPAALLECGVIINPAEEAELLTTERQQQTAAAVHEAVLALKRNIALSAQRSESATRKK